MIFGRHINRYYLRYAHWLLFGLLSLVAVDYLQLIIPNLYQMVINGVWWTGSGSPSTWIFCWTGSACPCWP